MQKSSLENTLKEVKTILTYQKRMENLKGESFNLFSILKMETKENNTHSAFIGELLNPRGSHLKGSEFLELFLKIIGNKSIDIQSAKVLLEKSIGKKDDKLKTGGRVDIYIKDKIGNTVCLENKIHAGDQNVQVERYRNHNNDKNQVVYLNLHGTEPANWSKGELEEGKDFYIISYKKEILEWLKECRLLAIDSPILRESIKQYYILIKKLTSTMESSNEKELIDLILKNYQASEYIYNNFKNARQSVAEQFRKDLAEELKTRLSKKFHVRLGTDAYKKWSKLWIESTSIDPEIIKFGIENFGENGHFDGDMFFGVFLEKENAANYAQFRGGKTLNKWWACVNILRVDEDPVNLGNMSLISKLNSNQTFRKGLLNELTEEVADLVTSEITYLEKFLEEKSLVRTK